MTDDRLERALSDAIADIAGTGSPDYLDDILERTSRTRQRPWWTFPGRYTTMTPTLKFAVAATLAFVLGVAVSPLVLPSGEGTVPGPAGVVAPDPTVEPAPLSAVDSAVTEPPIAFTGRFECGYGTNAPSKVTRKQHKSGDVEWLIVEDRGAEYRTSVESSDERLSGHLDSRWSSDQYWLPGGSAADERPLVVTDEWRITNDGGSWTGTWQGFFSGGSWEDFDLTDAVVILEGDGDYTGYQAIVHTDFQPVSVTECYVDIDGWIVQGGLPQA